MIVLAAHRPAPSGPVDRKWATARRARHATSGFRFMASEAYFPMASTSCEPTCGADDPLEASCGGKNWSPQLGVAIRAVPRSRARETQHDSSSDVDAHEAKIGDLLQTRYAGEDPLKASRGPDTGVRSAVRR